MMQNLSLTASASLCRANELAALNVLFRNVFTRDSYRLARVM